MAGCFGGKDFGSSFVSDVSEKIGEALNLAPFDPSAWDNLATHLTDFFPEVSVALQSIDPVRGSLNLELVEGVDQAFVSSYKEHYRFINPWADFLSRVMPGTIVHSERDCPARSFEDSEFYNDWLMPHRDIDASSAVMFEATSRDLVVLALHYPASMAESVGRASEEVLRRIRGPLKRSAEMTRRFEDVLVQERSAAALVGRSHDIAFVVDGDRRLGEMNDAAEAQFRLRRLLALRVNVVSILAPEVDIWLAETLQRLCRGIPTDSTSLIFRNHDAFFQMNVAPLPRLERVGGPVFSRPHFLIALRHLSGGTCERSVALMGPAFGLTAAEIRLCEALGQNHALKDAATFLGLTIGTTRDRLKTIFQKTGTRRQSELIALIKRLL